MSILDRVYPLLKESTSSLLSIVALANSVDIWLPGGANSVQGLDLKGESIVDDEAAELLEEARSIVYLLDNSGEAVVDLAAALALAARGRRVTVVARSLPYEVDVTLEEARAILVRVAEKLGYNPGLIELAGTGSLYPAPCRSMINGHVARLMEEADAVVSKGIANLEAFLENCPREPSHVIVALRAKCTPISRLLDVPRGYGVARLFRCKR